MNNSNSNSKINFNLSKEEETQFLKLVAKMTGVEIREETIDNLPYLVINGKKFLMDPSKINQEKQKEAITVWIQQCINNKK